MGNSSTKQSPRAQEPNRLGTSSAGTTSNIPPQPNRGTSSAPTTTTRGASNQINYSPSGHSAASSLSRLSGGGVALGSIGGGSGGGGSGPGAFVMPPKPASEQRYHVTVPNGVRSGSQFHVLINGQQMMVVCPPGVGPGDRLLLSAPSTTTPESSSSTKYVVTVPAGVEPGQVFRVRLNNQEVSVTCPPNVQVGQKITFTLPETPPPEAANPLMELYEVEVPQKTVPGQSFVLMAGGQKVMVTCPPNVVPGQKIRFSLPKIANEALLKAHRICNDKDGWMRCLGTDFKFRWIYSKSDEEKEDLSKKELNEREIESRGLVRMFNPKPSDLEFSLANQGSMTFVPASEYVLDPIVRGTQLSFQTITDIARRPFKEKVDWLKSQMNLLKIPYEKGGHVKIRVYRSSMLLNAMEAISSLGKENLRKVFRFEFIGEPALDAGGVTREFYSLIFEQACNPDVGLFLYSSANQMCVHINPNSHITNEHHLRYFHMLGRVLGKSLMDGQITPVHFIQPLYKHIMGWPIGLGDLQHLDEDLFRNYMGMVECSDVSELYLDFSVTEDRLGHVETVELCPGGREKELKNSNLTEFLSLNVDYRFLKRVGPQLNAFLRGFYDIIPEQLISVFNFQELELLLHGLPNIDMDDWIKHTEYTGEFQGNSGHSVVKWFWEIVRGYEQESKAKLLQFVTGTAGVPVQGFGFLQGNDGNIRKFTIQGDRNVKVFPRAHTCFNRIDMPIYKTKAEMSKYLTLAITMEATGFDIE